jgi:hypothetical protein
MRNRHIALATSLLVVLGSSALGGQELNHRFDHVINENGQGRLTLATGIPYVGIVEYAYGISDRVTMGAFVGVTPNVGGVGVRTRLVVHEPREDFRIYFCTPIAFYPKTKGLGGDPWWLVRPNINFEWMTNGGFRYKVGGGLVAAASHHSVFGDASKAHFSPDVWNTVHAGISFPIGRNATFQVENSLVLNGFKVAGKDWVGGPPVILVIGTSWTM